MILTLCTYFMRLYEDTEKEGDILNQIFKFLSPSYCLGASMYFDNAGQKIYDVREATEGTGDSLSIDPWHIANIKGDLYILGGHFVFWTIVLIIIETGLSRTCCICKKPMNKV